MNAQYATSMSNNAFIASNFLVPGGRSSNLQQTKSSRSPVSQKHGSFVGRVQGVKETESIFDEVNGSFALDNGPDPNQMEFDNAEEKLQNLAIQLGESCLTNDLACLMSQKRDLELVESARKIVRKPDLRRQWTVSPGVQRSFSLRNTLTEVPRFSADPDGAIKIQNVKTASDIQGQKTSLVQRANQILCKDKLQSQQNQCIRYRVVLLNILEKLVSLYSNEESRFLRQPISLLSCYLESNYFREHRDNKLVKEL